MTNYASTANFDELASYIKEQWDVLRPLAAQWADVARRAIQGLPYNAQRLMELEMRINTIRMDLRRAVLVVSEHFTEEQITLLQKQARISKPGWRSLKTNRMVTLKNGFSLVIY